MTPNTIELLELFPDGRIGYYGMPIKGTITKLFAEAVEAAKRDRVYFKLEDTENIKKILYQKGVAFIMEQGKPYPMPDGYFIAIRVDVNVEGNKYAILVPKDDNPLLTITDQMITKVVVKPSSNEYKQQCIERPTTLVGNSLDASYFKGGERINHFLANALMQLNEREMRILGENLLARCEPAKQQSIEEAALLARESLGIPMEEGSVAYAKGFEQGFIAGAKSQYSWNDIERAYCVGLLNRNITMDELSKALEEARPKLELLKQQFKQEKL